MPIHPTAIISPEASIDDSVEVGAYAIVEGNARISAGCKIAPQAQILSGVELAENVSVGRAAIIGEDPQDHSFDSSLKSGVKIGAETLIREHVTIHRSNQEGGFTKVGARNFLMVGSHLGHDVEMGDENVLANAVLVAGHCILGSHIFMGGGSVYHQFVRVGDYAMIQGNASISADIPPFTVASQLNQLFGLNVVGIRRAGFSKEVRSGLKSAYDHMFRSGKNRRQALEEVEGEEKGERGQFFKFFREESKKGICSPPAK